MILKRTVWPLFFLLIFCRCSGIQPKSNRPSEKHAFDHKYDFVYQATKTVLKTEGLTITTDDPDRGLIETAWTQGNYEKTKMKAFVIPLDSHNTLVDLAISIQRKKLTGGDFKPAKPEMFDYDVLFQKIDMQAYREYFSTMEKKSREKTD